MMIIVALVVLLMPCLANAMMAITMTTTISYTEPTVNNNGSALTNLESTTYTWTQDGHSTQTVVVPATAPTGGGDITQTIRLFTVYHCERVTVTITAMATNTSGENSAPTSPVEVILNSCSSPTLKDH